MATSPKVAFLLLALGVVACGDAGTSRPSLEAPPVDPSEVASGGSTAVDRYDAKAFSQPPPVLGFAKEANFKSGDLLFRGAPRGLGPLLNARTCQGCHVQDGRGALPGSPDEPPTALLIRLSVERDGRITPDPVYGDQLQTLGISGDGRARHDGALPRPDAELGDGAIGEAFVAVVWEPIGGEYPDGTAFELRRPVWVLRDLSYGPFADDLRLSPRMAPPMIGMGLLEAIPESDILSRTDPDDTDGDGISGRANVVFDRSRGEDRLGRFGWKASQPSVLQQIAGAFAGDIGTTSSVVPDEACTEGQTACLAAASEEADAGEGGVDVSDLELALVEFYARNLSVPRRRGWISGEQSWEPEIGRGRDLFTTVGCASCHVPSHETGVAEGSLLGEVDLVRLVQPAPALEHLSGQRIWPYTDLLLHDMGGSCAPLAREDEGGNPCRDGPDCRWVQRCDGLADGRSDALASGREWRTPPLWGLGLTHVVLPDATFLHDGRARTVEEAILWHDGEARRARLAFMDLPASDRDAVLAFLASQ